MKTTSLALLLLVAACGSKDDLELEGPAPADSPDADTSPPGPDASGPTTPPQEGALLPLVWGSTDFGQATYLLVSQLDFGQDDSLVVGSIIDDRSGSLYAPVSRIDRFAADGALLWTVQLAFDEFAGDIPVPDESDAIQIDGQSVHVRSIDHAADGTILVAFSVGLDYFNLGEEDWAWVYSTRNYIRSYGADGGVISTIALGGVTDFPTHDSVDELVVIHNIRALDDGSIAWTGATSRGQHPIDSWTLVSEGSFGRILADGTPVWTQVLGQELDSPNLVSPDEELAADILPTSDGGLAVRGHYMGNLVLGDLTATTPDRGTFVARVDMDGTPTWLATLEDSEPIAAWFVYTGMGLDAAGNLVTVSYVYEDGTSYLLQVDPAGEITGQTPIGDVSSLAVGGGHLVTAGSTAIDLGDYQWSWPGRVEVRRPDGTVLASRHLIDGEPPPDESSRPAVVAASPSGRIAAGGDFRVAIDLGDGRVTPPPGVDFAAYVAVYDGTCGAAGE